MSTARRRFRLALLLRAPQRQLYALGLVVRVALLLLATPETQREWFLPYLRDVGPGDLPDPWGAFLDRGGDPAAFPYGPVMLVLLWLPHTLGYQLGELFDHAELGGRLGLGLLLLAADIAVTVLLRTWSAHVRSTAALLWWSSPVVIYITYWHGQTDVLPVAMLVLGLWLLKHTRPVRGGLALGIALSLKLSVLVALPFAVLFALQFHRVRLYRTRFAAAMLLGLVPLASSLLFAPGLRQMIVGSEESGKLLELRLSSGSGGTVLVVPLLLALLLIGSWALRRINAAGLVAMVGLAYLVVLVPAPASTGWWLYLVPSAALILPNARRHRNVLALFSWLFVITQALVQSGASVPFADLSQPLAASLRLPEPFDLSAYAQTTLSAAALCVGYALITGGVTRTPYWRMSRRPVVVGIAGDSGSGKDTLARAVAGLFGGHAVGEILGDDYHKYERGHPMWSRLTHLDPAANELDQMSDDVARLSRGQAVVARHYDHDTGRFTGPRVTQSREVILVNGLHTLLLPHLRQNLDLKVYLDPDERVRLAWKIQRDVGERGHAAAAVRAAFERRAPDRMRYVAPQREFADLVMGLVPAGPPTEHASGVDRLALLVRCPRTPRTMRAVDLLRSWCRADVDLTHDVQHGTMSMNIHLPTLLANEMHEVAVALLEDLDDLLAEQLQWAPGYLGVMQLFVLLMIAERRGV